MNYKRILVIGDIHGQYLRFRSMYDKVNVSDEDLVIYLGDYIDRGFENVKMLKFIMEESKKPNVVTLCGNHEEMLLCDINNGLNVDYGWNTREELRKESGEFVNTVKDFLGNLDLSYSMKISEHDFFFCHAGIAPGVPLDEQSIDDLLWIREEFFDNYNGETTIVVGHTRVQYFGLPPKPVKLPNKNIILLDTGAYIEDGKISCLDLLSGKVWQNN